MCAYNPGITYDTTSIANGISNAGNALAQGYDQFKQNQLLASQATAKFEGTLSGNPEILQILNSDKVAPDISAAYAKLQKGGAVDMKSAALLSTFADSVAGAKQKAQAQQMQAMQLQQAQQAQDQQNQANQKAGALAQFASGNVGSMTPQAQASMKDALNNPVGKYIAQVYNYTGRAPSQEALTEFAKTIAANQTRTDALDPTTYTTTDNGDLNGAPITVTIDKRTGQTLGKAPVQLPVNVLPADQQIQVESGKEAGKAKAQADQALLTNVTANAEAAQQGLPQVNEIKKLYAKGVETGFGQDFKTNAAAFFHSIGVPVDSAKLGDQQYMKSLTEGQALAAAKQMAGQGSISENERNLLKNTVTQYANTAEGNLRILNMVSAIQQRHIDMEMKRQELVDAGEKDVPEFLKRWSSRNTVQSYLDKSSQAEKHVSAAEDILKKYNVAH